MTQNRLNKNEEMDKDTLTTKDSRIPLLKFRPILKEKLWGGNKILSFKGLPADSERHVGESWEISGMETEASIVAGGIYDGTPLPELIEILKERLVGKKVYEAFGNKFPILVKFIDAAQDLSIQVHPDDATAKRHGYPNGKTEMWYVLSAEPNAHIICGFNKPITSEEYKKAVADKTIVSVTRNHKASAGDCFFIPAGRVHSIGGGTFLIEIQQTSDVTYRIYDFDRRDKDGNLRELHTELAAEAINFNVEDDYRTHYTHEENNPVSLVDCSAFKTKLYDLTRPYTASYSDIDSFVIYVAYAGGGTLTDNYGNTAKLHKGESVLIPAETGSIGIEPGEGGLKFLETHL